MADEPYKHVDRQTLSDGTVINFYCPTSDDAPQLDDIMDEIYEVAIDALLRKLHD